MVTYLRKSIPKNKIALILAVFLAFMLAICIVPSWSSSPLDGIAKSVNEEVDRWVGDFMTSFVAMIADPFSPQLDSYVELNDGGFFGSSAIITYDKAYYRSVTMIDYIVTFSQRFGMIVATILIFTFLLLCMVGRSEQIHDSPISLFVKYAIAIFLIYFSWDITYGVIDLSKKIWVEYIMASTASTTSGTTTMGLEYAHFRADAHAFGFVTKTAGTILWNTFGLFFGIFIIWKLFKNFLKLLLEVAERYFVFTMLLFMFPAVVPAIISNATISVFQAYVRMVISQTFLILTNGLFLKVFCFVLMKGGWTNSLTGYVLSFAYIRFCTRIDSYLLTIGMNAAQTGGGMLESMGGAMQTVMATMRTGSQLGEMRHNLGVSTMNKALASGDKAGYERGAKMATPMTSFSKHAGETIPSFEQAMQKRGGMAGDRVPEYSQRRQGEKFGVEEKGSMSAITEAAGRSGMSSNQANEFVNRLEASGIKKEQIAGFKQVDGTKEFSGKAGSMQAAYDDKGHVLGYHSSEGGGDNYYVSNTQKDEIEKSDSSQVSANYLTADNSADVNSVLGDDVVPGSIVRSGSSDLGTQYYRYAKTNDTNVYEAEVSSASFHLDKINEKGYSMRSNSKGRDFLVKEKVVKEANTVS